MTSATSRSSVGIRGQRLTCTRRDGAIGQRRRAHGHCTHRCNSASIPASTAGRPVSATRAGTSLVPLPPSPNRKIGQFTLETFDHDASVRGTALFANDQLSMRGASSSKDVDTPGQEGRIVADDDEDRGRTPRKPRRQPRAASEGWCAPTDGQDPQRPHQCQPRIAGAMERRQSPILSSYVLRSPGITRRPGRSGTGIACASSTLAVTGRSPKQFARPRSSRRRYSRSATVPPSMSQSMSTTDLLADRDQARLVAHEVEVCPERVVQTPRSKLTVLRCLPRAPRTQFRREFRWLCRHSAAPVPAVRRGL